MRAILAGVLLALITSPLSGQLVIAASETDNRLLIVDQVSDTITTITLDEQPMGVAIHPWLPIGFVSTVEGNVLRVDLEPPQAVLSVSVGGTLVGLDVSPDGSTLYVTQSDTDSLLILSTSDLQAQRPPLTISQKPVDVTAHPFGNIAYVMKYRDPGGSLSQTLAVIDTEQNTASGSVATGLLPRDLAVSSTGLAITSDAGNNCPSSGGFTVFATAAPATATTVQLGHGTMGAAIRDAGTAILGVPCGDPKGIAYVNLQTATLERRLFPQLGEVSAVATNSSGSKAYVIGARSGQLQELSILDLQAETIISTTALSQFELRPRYLASQKGRVPPFLLPPIGGDLQITSKEISAVLDHSETTYNCDHNCVGCPKACDGLVTAFTGQQGKIEFGENLAPPGYRQDCSGTPFTLNNAVQYSGTTGGSISTTCGGGLDPDALHFLDYDGHSGYDFKYSEGTPILAAAEGILEVPTEDIINGNPGGFNSLRIRHSNGYETWYLHALEGSECILFPSCPPAPGASVEVRAGQQIATISDTGLACTCPHLHFEVRRSSDQHIIEPFGCTSEITAQNPDACIDYLWRDDGIYLDGFESGDLNRWTQVIP